MAITIRSLIQTLVFFPLFSLGTNYYVNDGSLTSDRWCTGIGNNANPGTQSLPFASVKYVVMNVALTSGDSILVDAGTYNDQDIVITGADAGVVIMGASRDLVLFDGGAGFSQPLFEIYGSNIHVLGFTAQRYGFSTGLKGQAITISDATGVRIGDCILQNMGTSGGEATIYISTTGTATTSAQLNGLIIRNVNGNFGGGIDVCANTLSGVPSLTVLISDCLIENVSKNQYNGGGLLVYKGLSAGGSTQAPVVTINNTVFGSLGNPCSAQRGGAVYISDGSTVTMNGACFGYCTATDVSGPDGGGAIYLLEGTLNLYDAVIFNNSANSGTPKYGGAIYANHTFSGSSTLHAERCIFTANTGLDGGAIYIDDAVADLRNCLIYSNTANDEGGAICLNDAGAGLVMYNCTVADNITTSGSGTRHGGLQNKQCASAVIKNSIFWSNTRADIADLGAGNVNVHYSIVDPTGGPTYTNVIGNLTSNPIFQNAAAGDYRLQAPSPAIDAGNTDGGLAPVLDLVSGSRTAIPDMGSYEFAAAAVSMRDCPTIRTTILPLESYTLGSQCEKGSLVLFWNPTPADRVLSLEGSSDGTTFTRFGFLSGNVSSYTLAMQGNIPAYFRLVVADLSGNSVTSNVLENTCWEHLMEWKLYPTISTTQVTVAGQVQDGGNIHIQVIQSDGRVIKEEDVYVNQGAVLYSIDTLEFPAGLYHVSWTLPDGSHRNFPFVKGE